MPSPPDPYHADAAAEASQPSPAKERIMSVNPYLFYNGNCEAAFKYYAKELGGEIEAMLSHEGTPASEQVPAEWQKKILHAKMTIDGAVLMAFDAPPGRFNKPQGF